MRTLLLASLCLPVIMTSYSHAAGVQIGRTRIIYDASKKEFSLPVINKDKELPWLVQSWTDTGDGKTRGPFIVTPPLFRLDPQKEQSLRIAWNGTTLPGDQESLFYMNIRTIPATAAEDSDKNVMRLIYKTRLKLFWRPNGLEGSSGETCKNLRFIRNGNQLTVVNEGAFYSVFDNVHLGKVNIKEADMIGPRTRIQLPLPANSSTATVTWRCITDYGTPSAEHTTLLAQE